MYVLDFETSELSRLLRPPVPHSQTASTDVQPGEQLFPIYQFGVHIHPDSGRPIIEPGPGTQHPGTSHTHPDGELHVAGQLVGGGTEAAVVVELFDLLDDETFPAPGGPASACGRLFRCWSGTLPQGT